MNDSRLRITCAALVFVFAHCVLTGCGGADRPATYPVSGTVTYRGKPVADASVTFMGNKAPRAAIGKTDSTGNFQLTTYEPNDGAVAGTHVVTVKKYDREPPPIPNAPASGEVSPDLEAKYTVELMRWTETAKFVVPKKYTDQKTSELRFEVVEGENEPKLELVD